MSACDRKDRNSLARLLHTVLLILVISLLSTTVSWAEREHWGRRDARVGRAAASTDIGPLVGETGPYLQMTMGDRRGAQIERLARFFDEIAFGGPLDGHVERGTGLNRLRGEVRVAATGVGAGRYRERVLADLTTFSRIIGVEVQPVEPGDNPNIVVEFVATPSFLVNREYVPCYAMIENDSPSAHHIERALIQISTEDPAQIGPCLNHEFMHAFGFQYHSGVVRSILSPAHDAATITTWDKLVLAVLYDPRLEPGLTREEAMPTVEQILAERMAAR